MQVAIRLQIRNDTASNWQNENPLLMEGELAIEQDTRKFKIGNGIDDWNNLPYATQGEKGKQGDPLQWDDLTHEQKEELRGKQGPPGTIENMNGLIHYYSENLEGISHMIDLSTANVFHAIVNQDTTFQIVNPEPNAHSFTLIIDLKSETTLTFPTSIKWQGGEIPDLAEPNKTYVLTFLTIDEGTTWLGMFGGEF